MPILDDINAASTPALIVLGIIEDQGIATPGGTASWAASRGVEQKKPENHVTVYDTGGDEADTGERDIRRRLIQVRTRSRTHDQGTNKQQEIQNALHSITNLDLNGAIRVLSFSVVSDIAFIGKSDNNAFLFTSNYRVLTQQL